MGAKVQKNQQMTSALMALCESLFCVPLSGSVRGALWCVTHSAVAQMVESVDTRDLNSLGQLRSCGFKSRSGYQPLGETHSCGERPVSLVFSIFVEHEIKIATSKYEENL